jgi:rSAM/selenodomain-associated transferase 1
MPDAIALFAKAPLAGRVKTRLSPGISPEQAAALHWAFVQDTWRTLREASGASLFVFSDVAWEPYDQLAGKSRTALQSPGDLGARMLRCFEQLHQQGFDRMLIAGSDSPTLPADRFAQGLELLSEFDAVLGPCEDGGYYAVGCRRPHPRMFDRIQWSTAEAFRETREAFHAVGYSIGVLPGWYDVDTTVDLRRLAKEAALPQHTRAWLRQHQDAVRALLDNEK